MDLVDWVAIVPAEDVGEVGPRVDALERAASDGREHRSRSSGSLLGAGEGQAFRPTTGPHSASSDRFLCARNPPAIPYTRAQLAGVSSAMRLTG